MADIAFQIDEAQPKPDVLDLLRKKSPLLLPRQPIEYLVDGLIVKGMVTVVAGPGSSGKSTVILHWCVKEFLPAGCDVLYLDRDNCLATVQDVLTRIVGDRTPDNFYFWGDWLTDDQGKPMLVPDATELTEIVKRLNSPVIIFDTLRKFASDYDENSNGEMSKFIDTLKTLTKQYGATVIVIHHDSKDGNSFRGASSIRDDADTLLQVKPVKNPNTFQLQTITITPTKGKVLLRGKTYLCDASGKPADEPTDEERVFAIVNQSPGITQESLEEQAIGLPRQKVREAMDHLIVARKIERRKVAGKKVKGKPSVGLYVCEHVIVATALDTPPWEE